MPPTIGRIVLYALTAEDALKINRRRTTGASIAERIAAPVWPIGAQAHIGNPVSVGQEFPLMVVAVRPLTFILNGQVFLDGNDVLWVVDAEQGPPGDAVQGKWRWPPRVG